MGAKRTTLLGGRSRTARLYSTREAAARGGGESLTENTREAEPLASGDPHLVGVA